MLLTELTPEQRASRHHYRTDMTTASGKGWLVCALMSIAFLACSPDAQAQSVGTGANASRPAISENADPISRFLQEKGLMDTKPVVELAQQVRDRASEMASDLVLGAMNFLGVPYRRGGSSPETGFDCSGFTRHVFENSIGLVLPRRASEQANSPDLVPVNQAELKPGDLVFFNTLKHTFSHVGIYIGGNKFIHSPRTGSEVRVEDMRDSYWQKRFDGARRAPQMVSAMLSNPPAAGRPSTNGNTTP